MVPMEMPLIDTRPRTADDIRALARLTGAQKIEEMIALDRKHDPFFAPWTPTGKVHAQWFATLWDECGYTFSWDVHLRRMHYKLVSAFPDLLTPDTTRVAGSIGVPSKPYANTEGCFNYLVHASLLVRALGLVDPRRIVDHRNPQVEDAGVLFDSPQASFTWDDYGLGGDLPGLPSTIGDDLDLEIPTISAHGYGYSLQRQPYLLEIWVEKSTVDDVLAPLTRSHGARIVTSVGFQSATNVVKHLHRVPRAQKPARIFYMSDYDPAGAAMPSAVARWEEFYGVQYAPGCEIKLTPVVLTRAQVEYYQLPRIPVKDSDNRKGRFEEVYGEGATELDALEALYPGELRRILARCLDPYIDRTLEERLAEAEDEATERLQEAWDDATDVLRDDAAELEADAKALYAKYQRRLALLSKRMERELAPIRARHEDLKERLVTAQETFGAPELEMPEPEVDPQGEEEWLYSSDRTYVEQNRYYQARKQGRTVADVDADAEARCQKQAAVAAMMEGTFPAGCPPYNTTLHRLGALCKRGHAWGTTGQSLRAISTKNAACLTCSAEYNYQRRHRRSGGDVCFPAWVYDPTGAAMQPADGALADSGGETGGVDGDTA